MSEEENPGIRGAHQLPGNVSAAAILSHVKLSFQSHALPVEEAMEAVPSGEAAPSGASQSSAPHVHWDDEMTRDMDGNIMPSSTPPPGQMATVSHSFNDDNDDVAGSPMSVSGEDVHDGNSQPRAGGQSSVPRDQPGGTANLGHSLRGTQPAGLQGNAALAAKHDRRNPLLNRGWEDVASRMAVITLPAAGRPYRRVHMEQALLESDVDCSTIVTLGEYANNFKYQVTFNDKPVADYFVRNYPTLPVKTDAGVFDCPVSSFLRREFRVKVAWFPDAGTDQEMAVAMSKWGEIVGIHREKIQGIFGHYYSGNRLVTLIPFHNIDDVPDFADMKAHGNTFTVRMTVWA